VTDVHGHAEPCFATGLPFPKPNSRQIIPRIILRPPRIKDRVASFLLQR
jgi:hypothetical protein